jgi:tetratricopeptide (TPR) repeat protein
MLCALRSLGLAVLFATLCPLSWAGTDGGRAHYDAGVFAHAEGDFASAEAHFQKALSFAPRNPYYHHYLGKTYLDTARLAEAAGPLEEAWRIDPGISGLRHDLATLCFRTGRFRDAIGHYEAILADDPSAVLARYYLGISYLRDGQYASALDHLRRAAEQSPTIRDNGDYHAGICYQELGRWEKAVEKFTHVRDHAASASLRESAQRRLTVLERQKAKPYRLYLQTGYMSDSNVLLEAVGQDLPSRKKDGALLGYVAGRWDLFTADTWTLGAGYSHYHLDYQRQDDFDLSASLPQIYLRKRFEPLAVCLTYTPHYYWLGGDDYLMKHEIRPDLVWRLTPRLSARLAYAYEVKKYFQTTDLSGHAHRFDVDLSWTLGQGLELHGGGGHEVNSADVPAQDYDRTQLRLGAVASLPWALRLHVMGKYTIKDYASPNPALGDLVREEQTLEGLANLSRRLLWDWLRIAAEYRFTRNDANIRFNKVDIFDYDRHQATLSLTASF